MTVRKVLLIAQRDFVASVSNRGFVIGLLFMPVMLAVLAVIGPRIIAARTPQVRGVVAVIDPTGRVVPGVREALAASSIESRRAEETRRALQQLGPGAADGGAAPMAQRARGQAPALTIIERPAVADPQREKAWLLEPAADPRLAMVVIKPDAVARQADGADFGGYDLYVTRNLDEATEAVIHDGVRLAVVNARLKASGMEIGQVETTMRVNRPSTMIVSAAGERKARPAFTRALPLLLGVLMFIGVMMGGQTLMTSTIEEKSSRVVEVLLATVSPVELMAGKLLGQMAVGLLAMGIYVGLGLFALYSFALLGFIDPMLVVFLIVFFLITYLVFGALMTAIGASVNQMADAQSLMGPVMILLVAPYVMAPMIARAPNSTFSVVVSFIPPVNTFAMLARLASDAPPPAWQAWLTAGVGVGAACAVVWFAAKIFKIGLLMHGKPPNFATLVRWARAA
jgi:ABC-2 type transport system permease protein